MLNSILINTLNAQLPPLHAEDNNPDPIAWIRLWEHDGTTNWYLYEGEKIRDECGFVTDFHIHALRVSEYGTQQEYWSLKELLEQPVIVRYDLSWRPLLLSEVRALHKV